MLTSVMTPLVCTTRYASPCGELLLGSLSGSLCLCDWTLRDAEHAPLRRIERRLHARCVDATGAAGEADLSVLDEARRQLDEYFAGHRRTCDVPLLPVGTPFQQRVWELLRLVAYGTTISYGRLATMLGRPLAVRAVAAAVGANGLSIFMPCHRVVGADGTLTGYAGGIGAKRFLLELEGALQK